jgi:hypothetical protein
MSPITALVVEAINGAKAAQAASQKVQPRAAAFATHGAPWTWKHGSVNNGNGLDVDQVLGAVKGAAPQKRSNAAGNLPAGGGPLSGQFKSRILHMPPQNILAGVPERQD